MSKHYDVIVIGAGVVGASTAFHLKKLSGASVALLDRDDICTGGTAKSCAICRSHYSIATNTQLTLKSLEIFKDFREVLEDPEAESGFINSGYLILSPPGRFSQSLACNLQTQASVGANTWQIDDKEALERHPWLNLDGVETIGFEPESGYADPYLTTTSFVRAARRLGVEVKTHTRVQDVIVRNGKTIGVRTDKGDIGAGTVVSSMGPWSATPLAGTGLRLPLEVSCHIVLTFKASEPYTATLPVVKDLTTENKMYFRPASGGVVLVGTGDHGDPVDNADTLNENVDLDFISLQGEQIARRMPVFADAELTASWVGPYDITPDWNPVIGPAPGIDGLYVAFGFSGHGFKLAPAVGRMLAKMVSGKEPEVAMSGYRMERFDEGELLTGAYGVGSIS